MCNNMVGVTISKGFDYTTIEVPCGRTSPDGTGDRVICNECRSDPAIMRSINQQEENARADNAWLRSAGWGEM